MAPFRVLRRGATRYKRLHSVSPPPSWGWEETAVKQAVDGARHDRSSEPRRARQEPRARLVVPTESVLRLTLKLSMVDPNCA